MTKKDARQKKNMGNYHKGLCVKAQKVIPSNVEKQNALNYNETCKCWTIRYKLWKNIINILLKVYFFLSLVFYARLYTSFQVTYSNRNTVHVTWKFVRHLAPAFDIFYVKLWNSVLALFKFESSISIIFQMAKRLCSLNSFFIWFIVAGGLNWRII